MYNVMLPHLSDISKIEVQVKDRYKLKANTKRGNKEEGMHVWESISFVYLLSACRLHFVQVWWQQRRTKIEGKDLTD